MNETPREKPASVGKILASARREKGKGISDVEQATKIRARFLLALEENNFGAISGDVYVRGFIKTYAEYLGLDPQPLIDQYIQEYDHPLKFDSKMRPREESSRPDGWNKKFVSTLAIVACFVLLLYWGAATSKRTYDREIKSAMNAKTPTSQPSKRTPSTKAPPTTAKPEGVNLSLTATSDEGCWLSITVDGRPVFEGILQKNQTQEFKGNQQVSLTIGNAGGLTIKRDGKDIGKLGEMGAVVERTFTVGEN